MKKFESIELVHLNGDSTVIIHEGVLDLHIEDVTKDYDFIDGEILKSLNCKSFMLDILFNENDEDVDVIKYLIENQNIISVILNYEKGKYKEIDLPYLPVSEEDETNVFQMTSEIVLKEVFQDAEVDDDDKILSLDISIYNFTEEEE